MELTLSVALTCEAGTRRLTGTILPYGVTGATNVGRITAQPGRLMLAEHVAGYVDHDGAPGSDNPDAQRQPVAILVDSTETDTGLTGTFEVDDTLAGDVLLAEAHRGVRTGLSVEIPDAVIRRGQLIGGTITGVAFVPAPAFPTAQLVASDHGHMLASFSSDEGTALQVAVDATAPDDLTYPYVVDFDPDAGTVIYDDGTGQLYQDSYTLDDTGTVATLGGSPVSVAAQTTYTPVDSVPAAQQPAPTEGDTVTEPVAAAAARRPRALTPASRTTPAAAAGDTRTLREVIAELTGRARAANGDRRALVAALADVTFTQIGADVNTPQWIGELWDGVTYERRIVPLLSQAELTRLKITGWHWTTKPAMASYAGDKAPITSNSVGTDTDSFDADRWAGGHDIDRAMVDFDNADFWTSYYQAMSESYSRLTDAAAFAAVEGGATPLDVTSTVFDPAGGVSLAATALVDAAIAVNETARPTFGIVAADLFRELLLTPRNNILELLSASLDLNSGSALGFSLVAGPSTMDPGTVIVGAKSAATHYELGGGAPIRVDAINIANGGVDAGVFGYSGTVINDADGLVSVDSATYAAPTP